MRGIDIKVDASWLLIAALVVWSFWNRFTVLHDQSGVAATALAVLTGGLFFGSIVAHELAHALEAQRRGVSVGGITLFVFGGATETRFDVRRPVDEFALTVVGPLTSFVLAAAFGLIATLTAGTALATVADVAGPLAWINGALGVFNLLPGAPLDGGRILRAAVWKVTHDRARATRVAAQSGQVVGGLLVALGIAELLFVTGGAFGGLWLAVIGWFLMRAARAELAQQHLEGLLGSHHARDLVPDDVVTVDVDDRVDAVIERHLRRLEATAVVVTRLGTPVGVLSVEQLQSLPASDRHRLTAGTVMRPIGDVPVVRAEAAASEVLDRVRADGMVVVGDTGSAPGIVTIERLQRFVERAEAIAHRSGAR